MHASSDFLIVIYLYIPKNLFIYLVGKFLNAFFWLFEMYTKV